MLSKLTAEQYKRMLEHKHKHDAILAAKRQNRWVPYQLQSLFTTAIWNNDTDSLVEQDLDEIISDQMIHLFLWFFSVIEPTIVSPESVNVYLDNRDDITDVCIEAIWRSKETRQQFSDDESPLPVYMVVVRIQQDKIVLTEMHANRHPRISGQKFDLSNLSNDDIPDFSTILATDTYKSFVEGFGKKLKVSEEII
jgi:hypothetical protein